MQQAFDFREECNVLARSFSNVSNIDWEMKTQFKNWSLNDIFVHLHFWNEMADWSLTDEARFQTRLAKVSDGLKMGGMRPIENEIIAPRGPELFEVWQSFSAVMSQRWSVLDPKLRVRWAGPDMSVRSSMTARQMETWAHGQAVFDVFDLARVESDRIKNIVILGVNTFGWSHKVQGLAVPGNMPRLELEAPSGAVWTFGDDGKTSIFGKAVEFAQVVTQTRNVADTDLRIEGDVAATWMATAQCFAGPPESPPQKGWRFVETGHNVQK